MQALPAQQSVPLASCPTEDEDAAETSQSSKVDQTNFSFSAFSTAEPVYPQLHREEVYVQKPLHLRDSEPQQPQSRFSSAKVVETEELKEFRAQLEEADQLRSLYQPNSDKKNWVQQLTSKFQKYVGDRTPKRPLLTLDDPAYYQKYFSDGVPVRSPLALNPEYTHPSANILKRAMSCGQSTEMLVGAGLCNVTALQLAEVYGLSIMDFRIQGKSAADMSKMFTDLHRLSDAGFHAKSFDANVWSLEKIASAYNTSPQDVIQHFDMLPSDVVAAGHPAAELDKYGIQFEHITQDPNCYNLIVATKLNPVDFFEKFNGAPRQIFSPEGVCKLNREQSKFLRVTQQWNREKLRKAGFDDFEIRAFRGKVKLSYQQPQNE